MEKNQERGSICSGSQTTSAPSGSFLRMSPGFITCQLVDGEWVTPQKMLFGDHWEPFCDHLPKAGGMRSGSIFARPTWEPVTSENDGFASPTSAASGGGESREWQTPNVCHGGNKTRGNERSGELLLAGQAEQWSTPQTRDEKGEGWEPQTHNHRPLNEQARHWTSPKTCSGGPNSNRENRPRTGGPDLQEQAASWATPAAGDDRRGSTPRTEKMKGNGARILNHEAAEFMPQDQAQTGSQSSPSGRILRQRLNPMFVAWLMGWPILWTRPEPHSYGSQVAELFRYRLRLLTRYYLGDS